MSASWHVPFVVDVSVDATGTGVTASVRLLRPEIAAVCAQAPPDPQQISATTSAALTRPTHAS